MWHPPPFSGNNLRLIVRDAPEGVEIAVPPGEFEGPFVFDRPLRLVGRGDRPQATTLWTRRGPAVIVRSAGVFLTNLSVELTLSEARQSDVALWYAAGCQPDTRGAQIQGRVEQMGTTHSSGGWKLPDLIDLGDLRAKYPVSLPMVIQVPGPARLQGELSDLHVQPARLPAGGEHLIRLGIPGDKLLKDTLLAGQLVIESGGETHAIWVIGRVLEDEFKAWVKDKMILVGKNGHKYGFGPGMLLGKEQLHGEAGAERIAEKQAYIIKETSGVWSLIQPLPASQPTLVNGQPVGVGRRVLLTGGEVIKVGSLELTVETKKTDLPVTVDACANFGKLSARGAVSPPVVTVQNNHKRNKWEGTLRSTVPWIQVPQPQVLCPGGQTVQLAVQLGAGLGGLPRQMINYTGALVLEGREETWAISAQLDVDVEEGLEVEPTTLDFGRVSDPGAAAPQHLRLRNTGSADWHGTVRVTPPWLAADRTALQCAPGAETTLEVRLTGQVAALPEGSNAVAEALKIEGEGLSVSVAARLHFDKPQVRLDAQPRSIDWGKVVDWRAAQPQTVQLRNTGTKAWQGKAESKVPWLEVTPTTLHCPAQGQATLTVRLTAPFQGLNVGEHKSPAAVQVEGEGITFSILARLVIEAPQVQPDTTLIDLVLDDRSALPHYALRLQNRGGQEWRGTIKTIRWLEVRPADVICPAGGQAMIDVTLSPEVGSIFKRPKTVTVPDAIRIESGAQSLLVGVRLEVKEAVASGVSVRVPPSPPAPEPKPTVVSPPQPVGAGMPAGLIVDWGTVSDWSGPLPTREIRLSNTQTQAMEGTVRSTLPWLEVAPTRFSCPPGQEVVLMARLTDRATSLRPKSYEVADALVIESGGKQHLVNTRLEVVRVSPGSRISIPTPPPKVEKPSPVASPLAPPARLEIDFGTVSDWSGSLPTREIRLSNTQAQAMEGTVRSTLPWLEVTPARFSCPPGQEVVLTVGLTKAASGLRPKTYDVPDAVKIECGGKTHPVNARLEVVKVSPARPVSLPVSPLTKPEPPRRERGERPPAPPRPAPALAGLGVDFGTVSDWSGPLPTREIRLSNTQSQPMSGAVRSTLPWLEVTPTSFSCPPGQETVLTVRLTQAATQLRTKTYAVTDALVVESGGKQHLVSARLDVVKVSPARPVSLPVAPPKEEKKELVAAAAAALPAGLAVDFGTVSDWSGPLPAQEIRLSNSQSQVMEGTVHSTLPWLEVTPTRFSCPPGQEVVLTARLTQAAIQLRPKTYDVADALVIESSGKKHLVRAHLEVMAGDHPLGMRTTLPPGEEESAEPAKPARPQKPAGGQKAKIEQPPTTLPEALVVEPMSIDWGTVSDWSGPLPTHEIKLSNRLKTDWRGTVRSTVPWMEVSPSEVVCPAGAAVTLQARLTRRGSRLRYKTYSATDALVIEGEGQKLHVEARLTISET